MIATGLLVLIIRIARAEKVSVVDSDVYPDEEEDTFIREPFVVKFSSDIIAGIDDFVIVADVDYRSCRSCALVERPD